MANMSHGAHTNESRALNLRRIPDKRNDGAYRRPQQQEHRVEFARARVSRQSVAVEAHHGVETLTKFLRSQF